MIALALLGAGTGPDATWRLLLVLGALPALSAVWLRCKMPEPLSYQAWIGELRPATAGPRRTRVDAA